MHNDKLKFNSYYLKFQKRRDKQYKKIRILLDIILLLIPLILCLILYIKLTSLQKQIDVLKVDNSIETSDMTTPNIHKINNQENNEENIEENKQENNQEINIDIIQDKSNNIENSPGSVENTSEQQKSTDNKQNNTVTKQNIEKQKFKGKTVYLTFDDGPSKYTNEILDILSEYNTKATFFVIGKTNSEAKKMYQRIVEEGHTLGMHSYSHDYNEIYKSVEDFDKDFTKLSDLLYDTTGYLPSIYRFPGGSSNQLNNLGISAYIQYLNEKSITYFDWNVDNGDATGKELTPKEMYQNVIDGVTMYQTSIVLMHDTNTKKNTIESLRLILDALIDGGAKVLPLDENVSPIQQVEVK